ncbi:uncharacterized protein LOC123719017 [Pieris brassicae]|uniref:uncharacterized protein LOC123719017 n=1 Tax=Pieris brassicae TaxID=7116 RepID=UPI001E65E9FD|nr:uncharacterized protein LOC123719017 [Pieris brassicae]
MLPVLLLVLVVKCQHIKSSNEGVKNVPCKGILPGYQERHTDSERKYIDDVVLVRPDILRLNIEDKDNAINVYDKDESIISSVESYKDGLNNHDNRKSINEANRFLSLNAALNEFPFSDPLKGFKSVHLSKRKRRGRKLKPPKPTKPATTKKNKLKTTTEETRYVYKVTVEINHQQEPANTPPPKDEDGSEEVPLLKRLLDLGIFSVFNFK